MVTLALALVATVLLTRHLGPSGYGSYATAIIYVSLFSVLADLGIPTLVTRELSRDWVSARVVARNALGLRLLLSLVAIGATLAVALALDRGDDPTTRAAVAIALPIIAVTAVSSTVAAVLQARLLMSRAAFVEVIAGAVTLGAIVVMIASDRGVLALVSTAVIGASVSSIGLWVAARPVLALTPAVDLARWRWIFRQAVPLGVALVLSTIYYRLDGVLLSLFKGREEVGIYGIAFRFLEMMVVFPAFFTLSVFPLLSETAHRRDLEAFRGIAQRSFDVLVIGAVPVTLGAIATAPAIVAVLGGAEFTEAVAPTRILALAGGAMFVILLFGTIMIALDRQRDLVVLSAAALVGNVTLNLLLIPSYGYNAAAAVATLTEVVVLAGAVVVVSRAADFRPRLGVLARSLVAGCVMFAAVWPVGNRLMLAVPIGVVIYVGLALALGVHRAIDLRAVLRSGAAGIAGEGQPSARRRARP